jgi:DNA-binding protein H-NS
MTNLTKEMHEKTATEAALRSTLERARREIEDKSAELRQEREALNRLTIATQEVRLSPYHLAMLFLLTLRLALVPQVVH